MSGCRPVCAPLWLCSLSGLTSTLANSQVRSASCALKTNQSSPLDFSYHECPPCERKRLRKAVSCGRQRTGVFSRGNGADDESTGSNSEGSGREAEVVGSSRDHGGDGPYDAALAGTAEGTRLQRVVGLPEAPSQSQASADEDGGGGVAALPGEVLRLQRTTLSRETARVARYQAELQLGKDSAANSRTGQAA